MTDKPLLHWVLVEAPSSWWYANGKAGQYTISPIHHGHRGISMPDGQYAEFYRDDDAREAAEVFERSYRETHPEELTLGRFWMVYGVDQRSPSRKHFTEDSARREARRLAERNPQITFVVLETTTAYRSERPTVNQFKIVERNPRDLDDDLPF